MQKRRRQFISKTALGALLLPLLSNFSFAKYLPKQFISDKRNKIKVKINSLAVRRNRGE
jgi:hypothetical protein